MNLGKNVQLQIALDYVSGTADRNGDEFDMQNYDGVLMVVHFAAIAGGATVSIKAQQDTVTGMGTAQDLLGTGQTVADDDDDQIFVIDLYRPLERFVRLVVDNDGANATAQSATYYGYHVNKSPTDNNVTDAVTYELHISPEEGTP